MEEVVSTYSSRKESDVAKTTCYAIVLDEDTVKKRIKGITMVRKIPIPITHGDDAHSTRYRITLNPKSGR